MIVFSFPKCTHALSLFFSSACSSLIGNENSCKNTCAANDIEVKSNSDLYKMAGTHNFILTRHVLIMEMMIGCYFRDCVKVVNLADEYRVTRKAKVPEDIMQVFYEGLGKQILR